MANLFGKNKLREIAEATRLYKLYIQGVSKNVALKHDESLKTWVFNSR